MSSQKFRIPIMKNLSFILFLFVITLIFPSILCQVYQLPPELSTQTEYIRLNSIHEINEPKLKLNNIYKRQVYKLSSESELKENDMSEEKKFQACEQYPAEVEFKPVGYYQLKMKDHENISESQVEKESRSLIYDYQVLKSQHKNVVDMTYYNDHIFTISSTGVIRIHHVNQSLQQGIQLIKTIDAIIWEKVIERRIARGKKQISQKTGNNDTNVEKQLTQQIQENLKFHHIKNGYFQLMDQTQVMLFANGELLIGVDIRTLRVTLLSEQTQIQLIFDHEEKDNVWEKENKNQDKVKQEDKEQEKQEQKLDQDSDWQEYRFEQQGYSLKLRRKYQYLGNFQSLTKIDQTHFGVLDKKRGAIIYKLKRPQATSVNPDLMYDIEKVDQISREKFGSVYGHDEEMNLVDMKYSVEKRLLLLLDYEKGVFAFERNQVNQVEQGTDFRLSYNRIIKKQCTLMEFSPESQSLYLSCNKIYRISLAKWPLLQQKTYLHPMINIRQIFSIQQQNLIVFAGYSNFKLLYLDRPAEYFRDDMLDKIVFHDSNKAITANQDAIYAYTYKVQPPLVVCQTKHQCMLGWHQVVFKTTAQCNQQYLNSVNFTNNLKPINYAQDICVYTTYKTLLIWKQGQFSETTMLIIFILVVLVSAIMLFWILITNFRTWRARRYLNSLATAGHTVLVQEAAQKSVKHPSGSDISSRNEVQTGESINKIVNFMTSDIHPQAKI